MAKETKSTSNFKAKYITLGVLVAVLIVAVVLVVVFGGKSEPKAIMEMNTNPSVQVVLDNNNKVVAEVALNADGEKMLANVSFIGLKAEAAVEKFAQTASNMGLMNKGDATTPDGAVKVEVNISAEKTGDYTALAKKVEENVNKYFSDNGIFAGAVAKVDTNISGALATMGANAKDFANKTTTELLSYAKTTADDLNKIAISKRDQITTKFNELYNSILKVADEAMIAAKNALDALGNVSDTLKKEAQELYDNALKTYKETKANLDRQFREFLSNLQTESTTILKDLEATAKETFKTTSDAFQQAVKSFKDKSESEKTEIQVDITAFQQTLKASVVI